MSQSPYPAAGIAGLTIFIVEDLGPDHPGEDYE